MLRLEGLYFTAIVFLCHVHVIIISQKLSQSSELRASVNESWRKLLAGMVDVNVHLLLLKNELGCVTNFPSFLEAEC